MDIGIVGVGAIGGKVAREIDIGFIPGIRVVGLAARNSAKLRSFSESLNSNPRLGSIAEWIDECDLVIEAAGAPAVPMIVEMAIDQRTPVLVMSSGALLDRDDLFQRAFENDVQIHVPSGAIAGLDGIQTAAVGRIDEVTVVNRKPPAALLGAPGVEKAGVDLRTLETPMTLFDGSVSEGFPLFPANVNVVAAVSMAGIGPDRTRMVVIADPGLTLNVHEVTVIGEVGTLKISIEGAPSAENPRTSASAAFSVLAYLRQMVSGRHLGI